MTWRRSDFKKEKPEIKNNKMDVTGGMTRKITEANNMAKAGLKIFFVNGKCLSEEQNSLLTRPRINYFFGNRR